MIKIYYILLASIGVCSAQVGVNTQNPNGVFHIDPLGNNTTAAVGVRFVDDVVVDALGNVGIGTNNPTAKLDIRSATESAMLRISNGVDANRAGKVLSWSVNDVASWAVPVTLVDVVSSNNNLNGIAPTGSDVRSMVGSITLPRGSWIIRYILNWTAIANGNNIFLDTYLSRSNTAVGDADFNNMVDGSWVIAPMPTWTSRATSEISLIYEVTAVSEILYLWFYYNGQGVRNGITSLTTGNTNVLEAIRWK